MERLVAMERLRGHGDTGLMERLGAHGETR